MDWTTILYALVGGVVPALLWLWFFLREDKAHPEPRPYLFFAFLLGALAIAVSLPLQYVTQCTMAVPFADILQYGCNTLSGAPVFVWATIEEVAKWLVIALFILWRKNIVDEPIDAMVYLITISLGFSAIETALFIFEPLSRGAFMESIATANLRFIGAALVHTLASGVVGFFIARTFYCNTLQKIGGLFTGLFLASVLHGMFNHHILKASGEDATIIFFGVWIGIIALFLLFERAKRITKKPCK
jgi:RsiW-degrading membrane proteinase PrsW (M82 family)